MKNNKMNKYVKWGLIINTITMTINRFVDIPKVKVISCFLMGIGISLLFFGIITTNHDMTRMKKFKKDLITKVVRNKKHV